MNAFFLTLVTLISFSSQYAHSFQETRVVRHSEVVVVLPVNSKLLKCSRSRDAETHNYDFLTLNVPPMRGVPFMEKGAQFERGIDRNFDPGCDHFNFDQATAAVGGKLRTKITYNTHIWWSGGYGAPCTEHESLQIAINLKPVLDEWVFITRTQVLSVWPSSRCD